MKAKYSVGDKVSVKSQDFSGRILDPKLRLYENLTGEIIESTNIVAFVGPTWPTLKDSGGRITIYHYTVRINEQVVLHDVLEQFLEIIS